MSVLQRSVLHDRQAALGAKFAEFGGWEMPLEYPGGGVVREHAAVRTTVGVFDVSHLGKVSVTGPGAADFVNSCLTADLGKIQPGKAQYTLCCDDASGGVVDDLIAYLHGEDEVFLVPNAANTAEVARRLAAAAPPGVVVENVHSDYSVLAVQGPRSTEVLADIGLPTDQEYMAFAMARWQDGEPFAVCRTGYTGEHGYELMPRVEFAGALWDALLDSARRQDGLACGLGARDTLRTEMGYPLHGHELSLDITPVQARLGWAVGWNKPEFWAHELLRKEKQEGARRLLWGLEAQDRGVPRAGMSVLDKEGASLGTVTSGTFSPTRRIGIALALLDRKAAEGSAVDVDVRGKPLPATVVRPPFVKPSTK